MLREEIKWNHGKCSVKTRVSRKLGGVEKGKTNTKNRK